MRRTLAILALSGLLAAVVGSASDLLVRGETIQAGTAADVTCDPDGIDANWGLETDTNSVQSVRFTDVHVDCVGAEMWAQVFGPNGVSLYKSSTPVVVTAAAALPGNAGVKFTIPAPHPSPEAIQSVRVWIEG